MPDERELLAGTAPGDPAQKPAPGQPGPAIVAQFRAFERGYRWRPFEPVRRPDVPAPSFKGWAANPVDRFVGSRLKLIGLAPSPPAAPAVLLRRLHLDLTGLAPTPLELRQFLADPSDAAYARSVDRLLASPHYGERWGRHWMDVWRYSDWTGYGEQVRDSQPHIWRWRDWIVDSLNTDLPYDRMLQLMLAGDEIAPLDPDALRATGYLVRNFKLLSREKWMQDVVDHTAQAFLGLTAGCARCHDHMTDPLTQREYYALRAVFETHQVRTDWVAGVADRAASGLARAYDAVPDAPTWFYERGDERRPMKDAPVPPGVPDSLGGRFSASAVDLPFLARHPSRQPHVLAAVRRAAEDDVAKARSALASAEGPVNRQAVVAAQAGLDALTAVLAVETLESDGRASGAPWEQAAREALRRQRTHDREAALLERLKAEQALAVAAPAARQKAEKTLAEARAALEKAEAALRLPLTTAFRPRHAENYPKVSSGRRRAFAEWLTDPSNPLAARVAVNYIWARHFGRGLVPSADNLGSSGVPPTHPELLDWLAAEFVRPEFQPGAPWSMKRLHRLLVTSAAYRQASRPRRDAQSRDPDTIWLWRFPPRRLDAELIRDNVLHVADALDPRLGGPEIDQEQGLRVPRRSIYFRHAPEKEMVFLSTFDGPNPLECYQRRETVVPQQALALFNSELSLAQSRRLARTLSGEGGAENGEFIRRAFERILGRLPGNAEAAECRAFLQAAASGGMDPGAEAPPGGMRARENLVLVLMNHHEFVTLR